MPRQREKGFADISGLAGCVKKAKGIFADDKGQSAGCLGCPAAAQEGCAISLAQAGSETR